MNENHRRVTFTVTIDGPPGGCKKRLLQVLEDAGYSVGEPAPHCGLRTRISVEVLAPHYEVNH